MKQQKCKQGKLGYCYDYGDCDNCEINQMILKYEKRIKKLKAIYEKEKKQAVKEFAEKLKEIAFQGYDPGMYIVNTQMIDELLKEYIQ